jgi:hypothetical protein
MNCPNYSNCQLIKIDGFLESEDKRQNYIKAYCTSDNEKWGNCKRYMTHHLLHFCPDFVLPDTLLCVDEIIDRYENEVSQ